MRLHLEECDSTDTADVEYVVLERRDDVVLVAVPPNADGASVAPDEPTSDVPIEGNDPVTLAILRVPSQSVRPLPLTFGGKADFAFPDPALAAPDSVGTFYRSGANDGAAGLGLSQTEDHRETPPSRVAARLAGGNPRPRGGA